MPEGGTEEQEIDVDSNERLRVLSALQSGLSHKSRRVSHSVDLCFVAPPSSLDQEPADVRASSSSNAHFVELYHWVQNNIIFMHQLPPSQDRDATARLGKLLQEFTSELGRLEQIKKHSWELEKIKAGLYGFTGADLNHPMVLSTGL